MTVAVGPAAARKHVFDFQSMPCELLSANERIAVGRPGTKLVRGNENSLVSYCY